MTSIPVRRSDRAFVLTGAGISAESGIRTFRDSNGLWEEHHVEDVASPAGWARDAALVWRFYSERRRQAATVKPNPAHETLARLEAHLGDGFYLCTQNVDSLHEAAGSQRLVHMHGELGKSRCENPGCPTEPKVDDRLYFSEREIAHCSCGARLRPHIVWFGEEPFEMTTIKRRVQGCTLFITVGTSGVVYPAAGLVREIVHRRSRGDRARSIYVGLETPGNAESFDDVRLGKAGEILPSLFELVA